MHIQPRMAPPGPGLCPERRRNIPADKALVVSRALGWRGETLGPRAVDLVRRTFMR